VATINAAGLASSLSAGSTIIIATLATTTPPTPTHPPCGRSRHGCDHGRAAYPQPAVEQY
jgi:hypothetical protein